MSRHKTNKLHLPKFILQETATVHNIFPAFSIYYLSLITKAVSLRPRKVIVNNETNKRRICMTSEVSCTVDVSQ